MNRRGGDGAPFCDAVICDLWCCGRALWWRRMLPGVAAARRWTVAAITASAHNPPCYLAHITTLPCSFSALQTTVERVFAFLLKKKVPRQTEGERAVVGYQPRLAAPLTRKLRCWVQLAACACAPPRHTPLVPTPLVFLMCFFPPIPSAAGMLLSSPFTSNYFSISQVELLVLYCLVLQLCGVEQLLGLPAAAAAVPPLAWHPSALLHLLPRACRVPFAALAWHPHPGRPSASQVEQQFEDFAEDFAGVWKKEWLRGMGAVLCLCVGALRVVV